MTPADLRATAVALREEDLGYDSEAMVCVLAANEIERLTKEIERLTAKPQPAGETVRVRVAVVIGERHGRQWRNRSSVHLSDFDCRC